MVNWSSPAELAKEGVAYGNLIFACFGLYVWEVFQTSDFELSILQRRRKLRWQWPTELTLRRMASFTVKSPINCQALYTFVCIAGNLSILCSSTTLMLRTIAVWERKLHIVIPLVGLCLAHWALLWRGMFIITADYAPTTLSCVVTTTNHVFLSVTFWATMGFNLIILVIHVIGLLRRDHSASIWEMLFKDGVIYYLGAFSCNALPAILNVVNLNAIMNLIATVPAAVLSAVAAGRTVISLPDPEDDDDVYVHSATQITAPRLPASAALRFSKNTRYPPRPEVHVTTDQIVMEDFDASPSSVTDKTPSLLHEDKTFNAV
ncbi:hypothetical protein L226DRAFT_571294 [Lentinus tigrinus ALCF2SS1-7]|uniref:Uncharacterized protein n=1 Tax=Lentinus tigrinus ALCF2SS1-6 TaxID=1328759 RepID=A0A5C2SFB8_9APHY|nr:hypothetical protein L227DRAFT_609778 [Lentinus tigrinus ALCF2SS1-6]RPD74388.1 hypothetical protein L226DRAFT_571294 [Lentinus tigrinus ALCF2SS1-7]